MTASDSDTTELPTDFSLHVSQRDGWWEVTSPEHPGLNLWHRDLRVILEDVPLSLATLIKSEPVMNDTTGWQPCATAPDDGRKVLAGFKGPVGWVIFIVHARPKSLGGIHVPGHPRSTHWMSIPEPPEATMAESTTAKKNNLP